MAKYYSSTLQKGSQGDEVKEWQNFLISQGYNEIEADGIFGQWTEQFTRDWQKANGLDVDGIVGEQSWGKAGYKLSPTSTDWSYEDFSYDDFTYGDFSYDDFTYDDYTESDSVTNAGNALNDHIATKPGAYESQWQSQLNSLMDSIMNRDKFSYDLNGDALYQQAKDKYVQLAKLGQADAIGQASAMTGGYGNSYAQSVGQQAYQSQLDNLNDIIPDLYAMALDQYNREGQDLYNQYGMLADRENADYGRYRDMVSDWTNERDYLQGVYNSERDFDYSQYLNERGFAYDKYSADRALAYDEYSSGRSLAYDKYSSDRALAYDEYATDKGLSYDEYRNAIADEQWQKEYDLANEQWQKEYDLKKEQWDYEKSLANDSNKSYSGTTSSGAKYNNGSLTNGQIKELQAALGVDADGKFGPATKEAAGGLTAEEAWAAYKNGTLGKKDNQPTIQPAKTNNTTDFINSFSDKARYLQAGHKLSEWNAYIEDKIASFLRNDRLTDEEALYLINYYGLS